MKFIYIFLFLKLFSAEDLDLSTLDQETNKWVNKYGLYDGLNYDIYNIFFHTLKFYQELSYSITSLSP